MLWRTGNANVAKAALSYSLGYVSTLILLNVIKFVDFLKKTTESSFIVQNGHLFKSVC